MRTIAAYLESDILLNKVVIQTRWHGILHPQNNW